MFKLPYQISFKNTLSLSETFTAYHPNVFTLSPYRKDEWEFPRNLITITHFFPSPELKSHSFLHPIFPLLLVLYCPC
jgi:hypothetical protein